MISKTRFSKESKLIIGVYKSIVIKLLIAVFLVGLTGCKTVELNSLSVGMSKEEVIKQLDKKPQKIGSKEHDSEIISVYTLKAWSPGSADAKDYFIFYFLSDKLVKFKKFDRYDFFAFKKEKGNWESHADKIYKEKQKNSFY